MPSMEVVAENNPFSQPVGPIIGRPVITLAGFEHAKNIDNQLIALVIHGQNSDQLRVQIYEAREDVGDINRVDNGPQTGAIQGSPGAALTKDWLVTASHGEGSGRLFLISWRMKPTGAEREGDSGTQFGPPGGTADIAYVGNTKSVVALKDADENLRVIVFNALSTSGEIQRHDGDAAGHIENNPSIAYAGPLATTDGLPTPASLGDVFVVTPCQTGNNRLKLICWRVGGNNIARRGDTGNDGPVIIGRPAIAGWPKENLVVCAYTQDRGPTLKSLELRTYRIVGDGQLDTVDSENLFLNDNFVPITNSPSIAFGLGDAGGGEVATAVRTSSARLRVDRWTVSANGSISHSAGGIYNAPERDITGSPSICPAVIGEDAGIPRGYYVTARLEGSNRPTITKWKFRND